MKVAEIQKIHQAGLISEQQCRDIISHFQLDRRGNRFLTIVGVIGAILVSAGIILIIASNWETIPRGVKLASAVSLLLGAHWGGWVLGRDGRHPVVAEALHLMGSGMFLSNIALVGQVYHLSSRPPNAMLLWLVGIAALPWILRSKAQHILTLCAFGLWLGLEMNQRDGWLYMGGDARQFLVYVLCGILFSACGMLLLRTRFVEFGPATEKFGLGALHLASYPLTIGIFYAQPSVTTAGMLIVGTISVFAIAGIVAAAMLIHEIPDAQWRWVWCAALTGVVALVWMGLVIQMEVSWRGARLARPHWIASPALFLLCLVQARVGLIRRSPWMVNLAIVFIGLHIVTAYLQLFGSMQTTGTMFLVTGSLLIMLAVYLERKRRWLLRRMDGSGGEPFKEIVP